MAVLFVSPDFQTKYLSFIFILNPVIHYLLYIELPPRVDNVNVRVDEKLKFSLNLKEFQYLETFHYL